MKTVIEADPLVERQANESQRVLGKSLRNAVPRRSQASYVAPPGRNPLGVLASQKATRVPELVAVRRQRMLADPFAFYRGAAGIMAADLADAPTTGVEVVACGDAHLSNFGFFASPQRNLVFDLNDFDESAVAPWEWDLKRLVTSIVIAARMAAHTSEDVRRTALLAARTYRRAILEYSWLTVLERYYLRAELDHARAGMHGEVRRVLDGALRKAATRTGQAYLDKITETMPDGTRRIIDDPPLIEHVPRTADDEQARLFAAYRKTVPVDVAALLAQYTVTDVVRRAGGIGSMGTYAHLAVLYGPNGEPLLLQLKEALPSVLNTFGRRPRRMLERRDDAEPGEGRRVVVNQRILQATSDPFLGWVTVKREFYVRQFRDMKGSVDPTRLNPRTLRSYVRSCAVLLARAHVQSGSSGLIAGYLGTSDVFDEAIVSWGHAYAEQSQADYELLRRSRH